MTVNFKDETDYETNYDFIEKWSWDFGDGKYFQFAKPLPPITSIDYFPVSFEITTKRGCKSSTGTSVFVGDIQKANFTKDTPDTICASQEVQFTDLSDDANLVNEWYWKFGDETTSTKQNPYMDLKVLVVWM